MKVQRLELFGDSVNQIPKGNAGAASTPEQQTRAKTERLLITSTTSSSLATNKITQYFSSTVPQ
jgi:hypothetical protein